MRHRIRFAGVSVLISLVMMLHAECRGRDEGAQAKEANESGSSIVAAPRRPPIEQRRREAEKLLDEFLTPVCATEPDNEERKRIRELIGHLKEESLKQWNVRSPQYKTSLVELGTDALSALRETVQENRGTQLAGEAQEVLRTIERSTKDHVVNSLRLLGWIAVDVLRERLATNDREIETARRTDSAQRLEIAEERNQQLCRLWSEIEMVPRSAPTDWRIVPPEYCYGGRDIKCPAGLEHVYRRLTPEEANKSGGVAEEYCRKKATDGTSPKDGPYVLWGPNGEAIEQGNFADGRRNGRWTFCSPVQVSERFYDRGVLVPEKTRVVGTPQWFVIDFDAAIAQKGTIWVPLGYTVYAVLGKEGDYCRMRYTAEIENPPGSPGKPSWVELLVPRSLGKQAFVRRTMGVDFSSLENYVVKPLQKNKDGTMERR